MIMSKSRFKFFLENMVFYGGLSMLTKAIPFLTLPIITRLLPDARSYGIADMFNLLSSFGVAITVLGMYDAVFREYFEDQNDTKYQKQVTATGLNIVIVSSLVGLILTIIFSKLLSNVLFGAPEYKSLVIFTGVGIFFTSLSSILQAPTRMRNQRKIFLVTGISFPIIGFITTYTLIKIGYTYEAIIFGNIIMGFLSFGTFLILNKKDFSLLIFNKQVAKELFGIGLPVVPTFLIYWVFKSMDKIMINKMLGSHELGIYSVGSKVASISLLIYSAFAGGWSYFAFSTMKDEDQVELNSKVFEYLGVISFVSLIISFPFCKACF